MVQLHNSYQGTSINDLAQKGEGGCNSKMVMGDFKERLLVSNFWVKPDVTKEYALCKFRFSNGYAETFGLELHLFLIFLDCQTNCCEEFCQFQD